MMILRNIETVVSTGSAYINCCVVEKEVPFHMHNFVEIAYVAQGHGFHTIGNHTYPTEKGHITLINYDVPHKFVAGEQPLVVYNCIFTPAYFDTMLSGSRNFFDVTDHFLLGNFYHEDFENFLDVTADGGENTHILTIYQRLLKEYTDKQTGYKEIMRGYLIELLILIFRLRQESQGKKNHHLSEVLDYISIHYTEDITLETLASIAGLSPSYFSKTFKTLTHTTVTEYLQTLRIEEACRLLKNTQKNVLEIALDVGYSDSKHFYTVFKKITGKLPMEFR